MQFVERQWSDEPFRLPPMPPALTWKQYRRRRGLGWRMVRAIELRTGHIVQLEDLVGAVYSLRHLPKYTMPILAAGWDDPYHPTRIEPVAEVAEVTMRLIRQSGQGFRVHYETTLDPEFQVLTYVGT